MDYKNLKFGLLVGIVVSISVLFLSGCFVAGVQDKGTLVMKITDARPDSNITAVEITISMIEVHKAGSGTEEVNETPPDTCNELCQYQGYGSGECRNAPVIPNATVCGEYEVDIGNTSDCTIPYEDGSPIIGVMYSCCCNTTAAPPIIENGTDESVGGWIVFSEETHVFDLLLLQGIEDIIGNKTFDVGKYTQIRLIVDSVLVTDSGIDYEATVPSGKIKLIHPFEINANQTTTLVLDFEVDKFLVKTGSGKYSVKPAQIKVY